MKSSLFSRVASAMIVGLLADCCLAAMPASQPSRPAAAAIKDAPPNTWVKVAEAPGPRLSFGLVYASGEKSFVVFGGQMMMDPVMDPGAVRSPYSEMTLAWDKGVWENRFPKGKEGWGPAAGPSKAPLFSDSYYAFKWKDKEGNVRPYLGAGYCNGMWLWGNYAFDAEAGRVAMYWALAHQMSEYDVAGRVWHAPTTAPDTPQDFRDGMLFGSMCYDPVNKEVLGGQGGWVHKGGQWRKLELGSQAASGLRAIVEMLRVRARALAGACRARYYITETDDEAKVKLDLTATALARDIAAFADEIRAAQGKAQRHEKAQLEWSAEALTAAQADLKKVETGLAGLVAQPPSAVNRVDAIHAADAARDAIGRAVLALAACPPRRAHARMVYDASNKKIVLFGGDTLDRVLGDTWVYDVAARQWEQRRPKVSPSPRAGYKLVWLPKAGKVLLTDGYGYKGGGQTWVYDTKENAWQLLAEGGAARPAAPGKDWFPAPAAADDNDTVVTFFGDGKGGLTTFAARIDATRIDAEGTAKLGVPPLAETPYPIFREDPQWYDNNAPPPDPATEEEFLRKLPPNTWTMRQSPNWPKIEYGGSRCWGTCALDSDRGQLLHFGGSHGTYDGNDVLHYSIRANRYYIGHRPEHTFQFTYYGGGIPACKTYQGRPFISAHTYHAYAYDPTLHKMVFAGTKTEDKCFTYDPSAGDWQLTLAMPFQANEFNFIFWRTKCAPTPQGVVAWSGQELWRVNAAGATWDKLAVQGKPGLPGFDESGIAYDAKRDRLLLFSADLKGDVQAVDAKGGKLAALDPAGKDRATAASRETVYIPEFDAVLVAARPDFGKLSRASAGPSAGSGQAGLDGKPRWLVYDCAKNAWLAVAFAGDDPIGKERFNVSLGLMYDPKRNLVWAMDIMSRPYVLRLDLTTADALPLAGVKPATASD